MKPTAERFAELKGQIARYVFGIRRKRENPVSLRQIQKHFYPADPHVISDGINDLLTDGIIDIRRNGPRNGHSHRQGFSYAPTDLTMAVVEMASEVLA
jgi:hypothetical protein